MKPESQNEFGQQISNFTYRLICFPGKYYLLTILHPLLDMHFQHFLFLGNLASFALCTFVSFTYRLTCVEEKKKRYNVRSNVPISRPPIKISLHT